MQGEASTRLGFTDYFRVELAWAKLLGAVLLLAPVPARLKEWVPSSGEPAKRPTRLVRHRKIRGPCQNRDCSLIDPGGMGGAYCASESHPSGAGMGVRRERSDAGPRQFGQLEVRTWPNPLKQVAFRSRAIEPAGRFTEVAP